MIFRPAREALVLVFQSYALFRYMTVYDNIAFGLKVQKADKTYIKKRVTELIELIGLKGLEKDIRASFPVDRDRELLLQGHWHRIRSYCFWMSRLPLLTLKSDRNFGHG